MQSSVTPLLFPLQLRERTAQSRAALVNRVPKVQWIKLLKKGST